MDRAAWSRACGLFCLCGVFAVIIGVPASTAHAENSNSHLQLWRVDGVSSQTIAVSKPAPRIAPLDNPPRRPARLRLDADTAIACDGYWQGEPALRSVGWVLGIEVYAVYQDPAEVICVNTYPFTVTDVYWIVQVDFGQWIKMQPVVASNVGTANCPLPGFLLCTGPMDSLFFDVGTWLVQLPLDSGCVVDEPYFACGYLPEEVVTNSVDLIFDADTGNGRACATFVDWGEGWFDMVPSFPNMILWSEGTTAEGPTCVCDCHNDPQCDGVTSVLDVVQCVNVAFKGASALPDPNALCPKNTTDVNCDDVTNVIDVVLMVNVAFKGSSAATQFCNACP